MTTKAVQDVAIKVFMDHMEREENERGERFRQYSEPASIYAYEIVRGRSGAAPAPGQDGNPRSDRTVPIARRMSPR